MSNLLRHKNFVFGICVILIIMYAAYSSFVALSESPPTWTDEGLIVQTSQNLAGQGIYGFQIGPQQLISPSFISTSFPVTYPIALSFKLFGIDLINARIVMAMYILALISATLFLFRNKAKEQVIWMLLLLSTFPPMYGHGKNVLGEIPGLFFIILSGTFLQLLENDKRSIRNWVLFGVCLGLGVVTKPIFIMVVPGFAFVIIRMYIQSPIKDLKPYVIMAFSSLVPILVWVSTQFFPSDNWISIFYYYSNPHSVDLFQAIVANLTDFFNSPRTLFVGVSFLVWSATLVYSWHKKRKIDSFEIYLYFFALLVFILYFRNPPYYRYFFIPEFLSLMFLSFNLFKFLFDKTWIKNAIRLLLLVLFIFQFYQLNFNSWVADSRGSRRTEELAKVVGLIPAEELVFFYQAPEAVVFLKHFNYYQYFSGTVSTQFGEENLHLIKDSSDLTIVTRKDLFLEESELFVDYKILIEFDRYVLLGK